MEARARTGAARRGRRRLNTDLFRRIAEEIRLAPDAYDQGREYAALPRADGERREGDALPRPEREREFGTSCGTPCCVAGWAYWLGGAAAGRDGRHADWEDQKKAARRLLGLTVKQTAALCRTVWPEEWFDAAGVAGGIERRIPGAREGLREPAAAEAAAIADWIAEHGRMPPGTPGEDAGGEDAEAA